MRLCSRPFFDTCREKPLTMRPAGHFLTAAPPVCVVYSPPYIVNACLCACVYRCVRILFCIRTCVGHIRSVRMQTHLPSVFVLSRAPLYPFPRVVPLPHLFPHSTLLPLRVDETLIYMYFSVLRGRDLALFCIVHLPPSSRADKCITYDDTTVIDPDIRRICVSFTSL